MSVSYLAANAACFTFLALFSTIGSAQCSEVSTDSTSAWYSSSTILPAATDRPSEADELPDAPAVSLIHGERPGDDGRYVSPGYRGTRPFRSLAAGLTLGSGGIGFELATPINSKFNLRGGAAFLNYTTSFDVDTIPIDGTLHLASAMAAVDWFPTGRSFHISPGLTFYNNTTYNALIFIAGNQVVTLNDQNYTSDPADPIHGTAFLKFGNRVAPRLTAGFGNVIRHRTSGFTFPVEFGVEYIKPPSATFILTGSSCQSPSDCGPIQNDPLTQQNILEQQQQIVNDLKFLRFLPILSVGMSYKFGH